MARSPFAARLAGDGERLMSPEVLRTRLQIAGWAVAAPVVVLA